MEILKLKNKELKSQSVDINYELLGKNPLILKVLKDNISEIEIKLNDLNIIIDFIENEIKRHAFKKMYISWFGGEPLLSLDKIIYAQERINSFVKKYNMVIDSSMTTNGYLLSIQVFKKLIEFYKIYKKLIFN